ncbi:7-carboxy-7-deazaguanine synthase QueE [Phormidesmis priestleyi ULC007]|uniref:7-carboxy-7-deazaguanine synthase n=1 Tax=Phormidesmis priestleyi ULC007 TaxID=1920490 RepID=A0A2T1D748_9CYAN|nr:7-carboxy-7-deazaguanine synthase QueE [Phormidesmis priestleyi]PSB16299.1 7-carboxy-7-deazaguanine synthase QueE [Phormidesmis priestleyi ULC007]PZO47001.1 MAG: 7-carboxy-7-deazaguanine synthase QueE [Phormidesmis priestleyi]
MIDFELTDRASTNQTTLPIVETFHSVQGEGAWTGTNAFFIRLGGCDVGCWFCDTKESWNPRRHPQRKIVDLVADAIAANPAIVVITGGEPLMHDLTELSHSLHDAGLRVHLETSGAHPFSGRFDWVTLSPKVSNPPQESVYAHASELKIVVANSQDLIWAEQQSAKVVASVICYLQAEWNTEGSRDLIFDYVLRHPQWRISVQTHKMLGVR